MGLIDCLLGGCCLCSLWYSDRRTQNETDIAAVSVRKQVWLQLGIVRIGLIKSKGSKSDTRDRISKKINFYS